MTFRVLALGSAAVVVLLATNAAAQSHIIDGQLGVASGVEGGNAGGGETEWQRARTRIAVGALLRVDETPEEGWMGLAFVEVEPSIGVGGEFRYWHAISGATGVFLGLTGSVAPETLFGGVVGLDLGFPIDEKLSLRVEPSFSALPLGSDNPGDSVLLWGLLTVGLRASL